MYGYGQQLPRPPYSNLSNMYPTGLQDIYSTIFVLLYGSICFYRWLGILLLFRHYLFCVIHVFSLILFYIFVWDYVYRMGTDQDPSNMLECYDPSRICEYYEMYGPMCRGRNLNELVFEYCEVRLLFVA
jgi:hypothetical protein